MAKASLRNHELLAEVVTCAVTVDARVTFVDASGSAWQDYLAHMIRACLEKCKRLHLKNVSQIDSHWTMSMFEDTIVPMSELAALMQRVTRNVGAIGYRKLLLSTVNVSHARAGCD